MTTEANDVLDLFEIFSTNRESEEDGRWVQLNDKTGFKIRALNAKAVIDLREKLAKPYAQLVRAGLKIPEEKNEELSLRVIAGGVIADWRGVKIGDQVDVPYSSEAAYALIKKLPKLANWVAGVATDADNFREEVREDGSKN
jgi:hypothetical protein